MLSEIVFTYLTNGSLLSKKVYTLQQDIPGIGMIRPQASYLVFLDCRALGLTQKELIRLFAEKAHLALNDGTMFGQPGEGFMRLNIGCPRSVLKQALQQLREAVVQ